MTEVENKGLPYLVYFYMSFIICRADQKHIVQFIYLHF